MECNIPAKVVARLGGGDDRFEMGAIVGMTSELHGGAGKDSMSGGKSRDEIFGEGGDDYIGGNAGDDHLNGGDGNDAFDGDLTQPSKTAGSDVYVGGPGAGDYVDYSPRFDALVVSLDGVANDGGAGEQDNVMPDVEGAVGGWGADTLTGNEAANYLYGGDGKDTLIGAAGDDDLLGAEGDDQLLGGDGDDKLEGGNSNDELDGGPGTDFFEGDDIGDPDCFFNPSMGCPSGADKIYARDGASEYVGCGPGVDLAVVDDVDNIADSASTWNQCEQVDRGQVVVLPPPGATPALPVAPPAALAVPPPPAGPANPATGGAPRVTRLSVSTLRRRSSTNVRYTLSKPASVTFTLERRVRRNGKTRFTNVRGSFRHTGRAGANTVRFAGRLGGRLVASGVYRLVAIARDSTGNASPPASTTLKVVRG